MKTRFLLLAVVLLSSSMTQTAETAEQKVESAETETMESMDGKKPILQRLDEGLKKGVSEASEKAKELTDESALRRSRSRFQGLLIYSPFDLLIPSKIGASLAWITGPDSSLELEYLRGTLKFPFILKDLGEMKDSRLSLIRRNYTLDGNFNVFYGLAYHSFHVKVGNEILSRLGFLPNLDIMDTSTLGVVAGIGSRWVFDRNITVGVDWISLSQGLFRLKKDAPILQRVTDANDRKNLDDVIKYSSFFPRLVLLKVQAGITF